MALQHALCVVLFACLVVLGDGYVKQQLRVAAFNIQTFGADKMKNQAVVDVLTEILTGYDITLIQEIREKTGVSIQTLLDKVNAYGKRLITDGTWAMELSNRSGSYERYQEQYAYFYNTRRVSVVETYQWEDEGFERPPFIVRFKALNSNLGRRGEIAKLKSPRPQVKKILEQERATVARRNERPEQYGKKQEKRPTAWKAKTKLENRKHQKQAAVDEFGFIGIHVKPSNAVVEIDRLVDVYNTTAHMWNLEDFIIGGDLNAGCSYVHDYDRINISLWTDDRFRWVITDDIDTTTSPNTNCPYDRLVLVGTNLQYAYVEKSAKICVFTEMHEFKKTNLMTKAVSDHYPVEMRLRT